MSGSMSVSSMGPPLVQCLPQLSGQWLIYIQSPAPSPPLLCPSRPNLSTCPPSRSLLSTTPPANTLRRDALITTTNTSTTINASTNLKLKHLSTCPPSLPRISIYAATIRSEPFRWPKFLFVKALRDKIHFQAMLIHWRLFSCYAYRRVDYQCNGRMKFSIWS